MISSGIPVGEDAKQRSLVYIISEDTALSVAADQRAEGGSRSVIITCTPKKRIAFVSMAEVLSSFLGRSKLSATLLRWQGKMRQRHG